MEIGLIFLAVMLGSLLFWLLRQSFNTQPWVADAVEESEYQAPFNARPKIVALTTFLAVVTSFFALIFSAYALRMDYGDWVPLTEPQLLWFNTGILVAASIAFQWTRNAAIRDDTAKLKPGMLISGVLTTAFLVGQYIAWQQLNASGQFISSNPSNAFFFLMTGLHALHMLGGMYVWARATLRLYGDSAGIRHSIELCTIYWHFLLLVWLIMFGLLLST
mgnify:CR=1 FL=1